MKVPPRLPAAARRLRGASSRVMVLLVGVALPGALCVLPALAQDGPQAEGSARVLLRPPASAATEGTGLLLRYRAALERESRRLVEKDPATLQSDAVDAGGYPVRGVRREATRIFAGANSRLLSQMLERALAESSSLRRARACVEGVQLDLMRGGAVRVGAPVAPGPARRSSEDPEGNVAASFSLLLAGRPRLEMRAVLPGDVRARVELPLSSPGFRTTLTRRILPNLRGTLSGGVEDSGAERWVSAGLAVRF